MLYKYSRFVYIISIISFFFSFFRIYVYSYNLYLFISCIVLFVSLYNFHFSYEFVEKHLNIIMFNCRRDF